MSPNIHLPIVFDRRMFGLCIMKRKLLCHLANLFKNDFDMEDKVPDVQHISYFF